MALRQKKTLFPFTCSCTRASVAFQQVQASVHDGEHQECEYLQQKTEKLGLFAFPGANRRGRKQRLGRGLRNSNVREKKCEG